jgi:hydrogenase expression/formation protein HypC
MCLGIPGQIVAIVNEDMNLATVEVAGVRRAVNIAYIVDAEHPVAACVGDWVLVHVGFAMVRIDEREAALTLALLRELGELQAELDTMTMTTSAPAAPLTIVCESSSPLREAGNVHS